MDLFQKCGFSGMDYFVKKEYLHLVPKLESYRPLIKMRGFPEKDMYISDNIKEI